MKLDHCPISELESNVVWSNIVVYLPVYILYKQSYYYYLFLESLD